LRLVLALLAIPLLLAPQLARAASSRSSARQLADGERVFNTAGCRQCHTLGGSGGTRGPNLSAIGKVVSKGAIRKQIVYGGKSMPPFGTILDKSDLDALVAYLHSRRGK
jgi:ubiquinol-cytochrome c reductase cytochrome b subunit